MPGESLGALEQVLIRVDLDRPLFTTDQVRRLPEAVWRSMLDSGLVSPAENAGAVECDGCSDGTRQDVWFAPATSKTPGRPYVCCPENGVLWIDPERLRQWSVDLPRLAGALAAALACAGRIEELVPGRLWLLGRTTLGGRQREAFLGRRLAATDGAAILSGCARLHAAVAPIVFVPEVVPRRDAWSTEPPPVVTLVHAASLEGAALVVDRAYVESAVGGARPKKDAGPVQRFPTPPGTTWAEVDIRLRDGESASVRVRGENRRVTYVEMGMADGRTARPDKQWALLETYAAERGALTWGRSADVRHRNKKRTERLAAALRSYFGIDGDPIEYVEATKGWRTTFALSAE